MKALVCQGPREATVEQVPDARTGRSTDVLVRVPSAEVCGPAPHAPRRPE
ncbi:hypothetical protein [Streptomyces sp. BBFR102]